MKKSYRNVQQVAPSVNKVQAAQAVEGEEADSNLEDERRQKVVDIQDEFFEFTQGGYKAVPSNQLLGRIDQYISRMRALIPEVENTPVAESLDMIIAQASTIRNGIEAAQSAEANAASTRHIPGTVGAYSSFEDLGRQAVSSLGNPREIEKFKASLARGVDFIAVVNAVQSYSNGQLVRFSNMHVAREGYDQGFFCRVDSGDTDSLSVLKSVQPSVTILRIIAPRAEEISLQANPTRVRVVFGPCQTKAPMGGQEQMIAEFGGTKLPRPDNGNAQGLAQRTGPTTNVPLAPSPAGLRCENYPLRNEPQRQMAHRLRQAWVIPEPLRADPSLLVSFATTLTLSGELVGQPQLTRSVSRQATREQLQQAADAGIEAIRRSTPFPELGEYAGGTMQVDMTPCD